VKRHKVLGPLIILAAAYIIWLGYGLLTYKPYRVRPVAAGQEIEGVYHLHSTFSDGRADVDSLAKTAAAAGAQFLIITDHGNPNLRSMASQAWRSGVLVLAGSELSVSRGHLVALGFDIPPTPFSQNFEAASREIQHRGGFTIIAHPYSKVAWTWSGSEAVSGLEILNGDTEVRYHFWRSLPWLPDLLLKPRLALLKMLRNPAQCLAKWDELNTTRRVYGYFSTDAHVLYGPLMSYLRVHIFLKQPLSPDFDTARRQVFESLRAGKFYNAVDAAAQARGFRFWASKNKRRIPMGSEVRVPLPVMFKIRAPYRFPKEVRLYRNGVPVFSSKKKVSFYAATELGTYRVEVFLTGKTALSREVPWIVSNPIFLREEKR
jgi:predicted metal-dependent phosphoesterase TrpH